MTIVTWLLIAAFLLVTEIITLGLTTIWFSIGAFAAALTAVFTANLWIQLLVFLVISVILWIFTRPIAVKHMHLGKEKTNVESLAGQHAVVTTDIDNLNGVGQVKINGLEWSARSVDGNPITTGTQVVIQAVQGVKLIVQPEIPVL